MNEILFLSDFYEGSEDVYTAYYYLSLHCHTTPSSQIKLYCGNKYSIFVLKDVSLTFPKIVYIDKFLLNTKISMEDSFPDLREVGKFDYIVGSNINEFGYISSIGFFVDMRQLMLPSPRKNYFSKLKCEPLGDDMYRFTSDKGSWDIRVNDYK